MPRIAAPAGPPPSRARRAVTPAFRPASRPTGLPASRPVLLAALAAALFAGPACDEKFQAFLTNASSRQVERESKKASEAERKARKENAISPDVRRALALVRDSDYDFVAVKGDKSRKRYSGFDFASMLESKSRWLGRGLDDLPTWLDEIGSQSFFGGRSYFVRLPDGQELNFRVWLEAELAILPELTPEEPKTP